MRGGINGGITSTNGGENGGITEANGGEFSVSPHYSFFFLPLCRWVSEAESGWPEADLGMPDL